MIIDKLKIVCYNRQKRERKGAAEMQTRWCELCGSCEVVQREGMYVCLFCGMEYTPKEAERLRHAGHALRAAAVRGIRERAGGRRPAAQVRKAPLTPAAPVPVAPSAALFLLIL